MTKQTISTVQSGNLIRIATSNGYTVSIGIGPYHYCDNKDYSDRSVDTPCETPTATVEVAVLDAEGNLDYSYTGGNDVAGNVPVSRLGEIVAAVEAGDAEACSLAVSRPDEDEDEDEAESDYWNDVASQGEYDGDALASAGFGTDEDYGCYGGDEW